MAAMGGGGLNDMSMEDFLACCFDARRAAQARAQVESNQEQLLLQQQAGVEAALEEGVDGAEFSLLDALSSVDKDRTIEILQVASMSICIEVEVVVLVMVAG
jgi:hypothetical protein